MKNISTHINKDDHSIKVCLNTNLDITEIDKRINQIESNIYLNRLKEQYKQLQENKIKYKSKSLFTTEQLYNSVRLFCLDTQLIYFNDIEVMEDEINRSF